MLIFSLLLPLFSLSFIWNPHPSPPSPPSLRSLLPNSGNPPLCTPVTQRKDMEYCHETKARERKHFSLQDPAEVHYLEAGASTGVWGQDTNECLSVSVWWGHVGILSDYRAVVVSLSNVKKEQEKYSAIKSAENAGEVELKGFCVYFAWLRNMWGSPRHHTLHDWLQVDAAFLSRITPPNRCDVLLNLFHLLFIHLHRLRGRNRYRWS